MKRFLLFSTFIFCLFGMVHGVSIKKLSEDNWQAYKEFCITTCINNPFVFSLTPEELNRREDIFWKNMLAQNQRPEGNKVFFACNDKNKIIGMIELLINPFGEPHQKHIVMLKDLCVSEGYDQKNIGKKLILTALKDIQDPKYRINIAINPQLSSLANACKKSGLTFDGAMKKAHFTKGRFYDVHLYSRKTVQPSGACLQIKKEKNFENNAQNITIASLSAKQWKQFKNLYLEALKGNPTGYPQCFDKESTRKDLYWQDKLKKDTTKVNEFYPSGDRYLFAKKDNKIVGMIGIELSRGKKRKHAYLYDIYVKKEFRNQGIEELLIDAGLKQLKHVDIKAVYTLINSQSNKQIQAYANKDFEPSWIIKDILRIKKQYYDMLFMTHLL